MSTLDVYDHAAILALIDPPMAIAAVRDGFLKHHRGEWTMPAKVYLDSPPGDFRAMPARGDGLAIVKWICWFPGNVTGVVVACDAATGTPLALLDARAITALRTGAVAAVAARALAPAQARTVGIIGCGVHGAWAARCLAADGYGPGVCCDPREEAASALAQELGWEVGDRRAALRCEIVCAVTPGDVVVIDAGDLRPGLHLNMLGADAAGKAEASVGAVASCRCFCDEWEQASHGGELHGAVAAGQVRRADVTELGAVLAGDARGRPGPEAVTLFDSTGLAIQDLAITHLCLSAAGEGQISAQTLTL
ncbi:MAG TPA: hypothetical protein VHX88_09550 [Solirubrobacteraceae bacterium]|jgi:ornithine cyclodeaminase/alanine dehydrogenase-like protein (mu-crystallin family)|nr:hypothetical protein [Solirubrobacteraceae bacterium]